MASATATHVVAVVGGTHGNELAGVHLVRKMQRHPQAFVRPGIWVLPVLANPTAVERGVRFVDCDLNRCMAPEILSPPDKSQCIPVKHEEARARELAAELGGAAIVLDLHNTTSNSGTMIIISDELDTLTLQLAAALRAAEPDRRVWLPVPPGKERVLCNVGSVAACDIGIELGPQAHGLCRADIFAKAERTVHDALDFAERALGDLCAEALPATELEIYRWTGELVLFPLDVTTGKPAALVHESLQDADWKPLKPGDPVFRMLDGTGEPMLWDGAEVFPVFINEVAYCAPAPLGNAANVAFFPCTRETIVVPALTAT